jgi:HlyD family secretion protein
VGRIQVGAQATFRVDTFPRETFYGRVSQVRMNAGIIQNVVTYNTTIEFDNPNVRLFPGMTAYVSIPVAWANDVVKVPNGALRFKPDLSDSERQTLYAKYGIKESSRGTAAGRIGSAAGGGGTVAAAAGQNGGGGGANDAGQGPRNGQGQGGGGRRAQQAGGDAGAGGGGQTGGRPGVANSLREDSGIVWKLNPDKTLEPIQVGLGVTDFTFTAMTSGKLNPGDDLVIGQSTTKNTAAQTQTRSPVGGPGAPGGPGGGPRRF